MPLKSVPKFVRGDPPTTFAATIPWRATLPRISEEGGSEKSGAGVVAAYQVRKDALLVTRLRFTEDEWPEVEALVDAGKAGEVIQVYPDQAISMYHSCYLESPVMGEGYGPERDEEFLPGLALTLTWRRTTSAPFDAKYFTD
jgi:hypothetical protein